MSGLSIATAESGCTWDPVFPSVEVPALDLYKGGGSEGHLYTGNSSSLISR